MDTCASPFSTSRKHTVPTRFGSNAMCTLSMSCSAASPNPKCSAMNARNCDVSSCRINSWRSVPVLSTYLVCGNQDMPMAQPTHHEVASTNANC